MIVDLLCAHFNCLDEFQSIYAPECDLGDAVKDLSSELRAMTAMIPVSAFLIPYGDCNDHGVSTGSGCKEVHGQACP